MGAGVAHRAGRPTKTREDHQPRSHCPSRAVGKSTPARAPDARRQRPRAPDAWRALPRGGMCCVVAPLPDPALRSGGDDAPGPRT